MNTKWVVGIYDWDTKTVDVHQFNSLALADEHLNHFINSSLNALEDAVVNHAIVMMYHCGPVTTKDLLDLTRKVFPRLTIMTTILEWNKDPIDSRLIPTKSWL